MNTVDKFNWLVDCVRGSFDGGILTFKVRLLMSEVDKAIEENPDRFGTNAHQAAMVVDRMYELFKYVEEKSSKKT